MVSVQSNGHDGGKVLLWWLDPSIPDDPDDDDPDDIGSSCSGGGDNCASMARIGIGMFRWVIMPVSKE
jgi:hypothetical protein